MKAKITTENDYVKAVSLLCSPLEALHIQSALLCYSEHGDNNTDRIEAKQMADEFMLAVAEATGEEKNMNLAYAVIGGERKSDG